MEIEKKGDLDSNWEDIYTLLKNGDWKAAGEFCEKRMRDSYKSPAFLTAVKCVRFWSNAYEEAEVCIRNFAEMFTDYLKSVLGDKYDKACLMIREFDCEIPDGISSEEYLGLVRGSHTV